MSAPLVLRAPLTGWCMPLDEVPDPVFSQRLAGDGVAIDPTCGSVVAPCDGEIVLMKDARHAITVRAAPGLDVLVHVGIDTVNLGGEGFELLVAAGDRVRAGVELLRFDLDALARRAPSVATPIVLAAGGSIIRRAASRAIEAGEPLMDVIAGPGAAGVAGVGEALRRSLRVPFEHGLHVRPAAQLAAALRPFACTVVLGVRGRSANARSTVEIMALEAQRGDVVEAIATGTDAALALAALEQLLPMARDIAPAEAARPAQASCAKDPRRIEASIASRGVAVGRVARWDLPEISVAEQGAGSAGERAALEDAIGRVREHLAGLAAAAPREARALLEAHGELVTDPGLRARAEDWIDRGKSASFAWRAAARAVGASLAAMQDARMRERASDLRDLEGQVLRALAGHDPAAPRHFEPDAVVIAEDLPPSAILGLARGAIAGFCTARGGSTSHVSILAAAAGIPALVAAGARVLDIAEGTLVVLDAEHGWIDIDPPSSELAAFERAVSRRREERAADAAAARAEARTRDGERVHILANLGSLGEVDEALRGGAEGCGLLRTEFLYLDRATAPGEDEQALEYQRIADALGARPLAIRTLDVGGDKPIAYLPLPREENPALGLRGLRASLWQPELLRTQLRAILRVRGGHVRILLPMVTDVDEVTGVRALTEALAHELGVAVPAIGVMVETPSAALLAEPLAASADFFSIGSNDLAQYALAIDRAHPELSRRLDALHPAVLRLVALVTEAGRARGRPVSLCGALGSDVDALPILIGLGVYEISAAPSAIPRLKRMARLLDATECRDAARRALLLHTAVQVRELSAVLRARARAASEAVPGDNA